eukprot:12423758-Karenia_brevis.AAC.1
MAASAYYGKNKKLRDDTWRGVGADIQRRFTSGDLSPDLHFLSFADRAITAEGWAVLATVLHQLRSCLSLDLQRCDIKDVGKLVELLPDLVQKTKCYNLEGNALSAKSVRKLAAAMASAYGHIRPSWLSIGLDAQTAASKCLVKSVCHPYHPRGCMCSKPSVVHIVQCLPKYDALAKLRWEDEYLRPLDQYIVNQTNLSQPSADPLNVCHESLPTVPILNCELLSTPPTKTPSGDESPKELHKDGDFSDSAHSLEALRTDDTHIIRCEVPVASNTVGHSASVPAQAMEIRAQTLCASGPAEALMAYVASEKRAHQIEMICRLASLSDIGTAPLEAAARFTRSQISNALADFRAGGKLSCWLVGERMLLLAAFADSRLVLIDLTESASRGYVVDVRGAPACGARPIHDFNFRIVALGFNARPDQQELDAEGGEVLEINKEHMMHLASGWVAARRLGSSAFLWFPLDRCCVYIPE